MELLFSLRGCGGIADLVNGTLIGNLDKSMVEVAEGCRIFSLAVNMSMTLFGIPSGLACALVAYRNSSRRNIASVLLVANSVSSNLVLASAVPMVVLANYSPASVPVVSCMLFAWIMASMHCINVWTLLMLMVTRFVAVASPVTLFNQLLLGKGSVYCLLVVCCLTFVYCARFFFYSWDHSCNMVITDEMRVWLFIVVEFLVPSVAIAGLSVGMWVMIGRRRIRMYQSTYKQSVMSMKITLANCGWILVSILPIIVHFSVPVADFYQLANSPNSIWPSVRLRVSEMLLVQAFFLRHSADVLIYIACSHRFRAAIVDFLRLESLLPARLAEYVDLKSRHSVGLGLYTEGSQGSSYRPYITSARSALNIHRTEDEEDKDKDKGKAKAAGGGAVQEEEVVAGKEQKERSKQIQIK